MTTSELNQDIPREIGSIALFGYQSRETLVSFPYASFIEQRTSAGEIKIVGITTYIQESWAFYDWIFGKSLEDHWY